MYPNNAVYTGINLKNVSCHHGKFPNLQAMFRKENENPPKKTKRKLSCGYNLLAPPCYLLSII